MSIDPLPRVTRLALNGPTMGSRWSAICLADDVDREDLRSAFASACQRVDDQMSTWKPQSDLMRLNRHRVGEWMDVPEELAYVLALGEGVRQRSGGLFDMALLAEVQATGFGPDLPTMPTGSFSSDPSLEVDLVNQRARRLADRHFDLSGIAKGFGVDLLARTAEKFGISDYLVSIDGEVQAGGWRDDGRPWLVALEAPIEGRRDIAARLELHNASLATSGNYRQSRLKDGRRISHTIDPRTGAPLENDLVSVTVQMPDCVLADAWATALLVAGRAQSRILCDQFGLSAILIADTSSGPVQTGFGDFANG